MVAVFCSFFFFAFVVHDFSFSFHSSFSFFHPFFLDSFFFGFFLFIFFFFTLFFFTSFCKKMKHILLNNFSLSLFLFFFFYLKCISSFFSFYIISFILKNILFIFTPFSSFHFFSIFHSIISKTQKMRLDTSLFNTKHNKVLIKGMWSSPEKG